MGREHIHTEKDPTCRVALHAVQFQVGGPYRIRLVSNKSWCSEIRVVAPVKIKKPMYTYKLGYLSNIISNKTSSLNFVHQQQYGIHNKTRIIEEDQPLCLVFKLGCFGHSWESLGKHHPPMPRLPPENKALLWAINHWFPLIRPY